ncbi:MAG: DNA internalization-related competence protein ComEC/Rec2 [Wenzhouxiangella sp.]
MDWRLLLAFAAGSILATLAPVVPGTGWVLAVSACSITLLYWRRWHVAAAFVLGVSWFLLQAGWLLDRQWPAELAGERITLTGTISGLPEPRDQSTRFVFRPDADPGNRLPGRIMVSWYRPREYLQAGQRWEMTLRLEPPHGRLTPSGFDFNRHLLSNRIGALGSVIGQPKQLTTGGLFGSADRRRQYLGEVLQSETVSPDAAALKRALAIADRGGMTPELSDMLRQTGTAHLLAISGLHVGMVAALAGFLASWLLAPLVLVNSRVDRRRLAIAAALLAAAAYAMLAGFTLPTQRALIMLLVAGGAFLLRRGILPGHALLLALVAVVLFDPMSPLATGFWLSFAAVTVLIWAFAWRPGSAPGGGLEWLSGLIRAQLMIAVGMLALNVGVFQQVIPVALVANLVAIPLVGFWILPSLLLSVGLILLDLPAAWVIKVTEIGLGLLLSLLGSLHEFDFGRQVVVGGGLAAMVLAMVGAFWLLAPPAWPARWLGLFLLVPLLWPRVEMPGPGALELHMLDVGNGLAVLIRTDEEWILYDSGPGDGEGGDALGRILPGLVGNMQPGAIDRIVISHAHRGHAGGLGSVQDLVNEHHLYSPGMIEGQKCVTGSGWNSGSYRFEFLHPSEALPDLGSNSSCVLHISGPGGTALLTGGIDSAVEARLVVENPDLNLDVLVLSAGGHRRATSKAFLDHTRPGLALASVPGFDRTGRPHPEVLQNIKDIPLVTTAGCGTITVTMAPGTQPSIRSMAGQHPRFWRPHRDCP